MQITRRESFLSLASLFVLPYSLKASESSSVSSDCEITEIITDPNKIDKSKYEAYFKVEDKSGQSFFIVQKKNCRLEDAFVFGPSRENKKVFSKPLDFSKPVLTVDSSKVLGVDGKFEIYDDRNGGYDVKYNYFSGLIDVPSHTSVSSRFLLNVDKGIKRLPQSLRQDLYNRGVRILLGRNVEDTYYRYYPSWKTQDLNARNDESKPWLEVNGDGCKDHRKNINITALYTQKRVIIPQEHVQYKTNRVLDRLDFDDSWTFDTVGHELGHAIDFFNQDDYYENNSGTYYAQKKIYSSNGNNFYRQGVYSHEGEFLMTFKMDKERMEPDLKKKVAYLWCKPEGGQQEGFADITAALLGAFTPEKTALTLSAFPMTAEYIRKKVLPDFKVNLSIEEVKEKYPEYLKDSMLVQISK